MFEAHPITNHVLKYNRTYQSSGYYFLSHQNWSICFSTFKKSLIWTLKRPSIFMPSTHCFLIQPYLWKICNVGANLTKFDNLFRWRGSPKQLHDHFPPKSTRNNVIHRALALMAVSCFFTAFQHLERSLSVSFD